MFRRAQALLELALFLGLMLMVLLAALNYQRNLREQRKSDQNVFDQATERAYKEVFEEEDLEGETWTCTGAVVSYSLNADRQANRIFQGGQRRSSGSSASIYWSGAEDPPNRDFNYYNTDTDISSGEEPIKLYYDRPGTADPEDEMKLSTGEYIIAMYPIISEVAQGVWKGIAKHNKVIKESLNEIKWWKNWGGYLDTAIRLASFAFFATKFYNALKRIDDAEEERKKLEDLDEQMGEWGWRVCDIVHDGEDLAGKKYVKEITPQVYDSEVAEDKSVAYNETQQANTSVRNVTAGDKVVHKIYRRYDVTKPDPTIELNLHEFQDLGSKEVTVDLGGSQSETWN
jgi:hypothetical protein